MSRPMTPLQIERALERERKAQERAEKQAYLEARMDETEDQNEALNQRITDLETLLEGTLDVDDYIHIDRLKEREVLPTFDQLDLLNVEPPPSAEQFVPSPPNFLFRLIPGSSARHERACDEGERALSIARADWERRETERKERLQLAQEAHERRIAAAKSRLKKQHDEIEAFKLAFSRGEPEAVARYYSLVLTASKYPSDFPKHSKLAFVPESKLLVVEIDLPNFDVVPQVREFKYVKAKGQITTASRPLSERKLLYTRIISQIALRTIHELFEADRVGQLDSVIFNGYVETIDRSTGNQIRPCLITVRTTREVFSRIDLSHVDPEACLKGLSASVSKRPTDLAPVRPVLEFSMVDPRFVEESDVLSTLDQRPNLMKLSPSEFESLITNLFAKMGLDTRLTQASRDGGVDCVAYDPRPIFGGKVVIQAKRYKHTVGVSAVRDLFGTVQNEGASKGILVKTSGFGSASFEFAQNKPLELLSGSNLLHLLAEHAGIEAKIEAPDDWVDPIADVAVPV